MKLRNGILPCLIAILTTLSGLVSLAARAQLDQSGAAPVGAPDFSNLPMSFERNEGQAPPEVRYIGRGLGYTTYLTDTEAVLVLAAPSAKMNNPSRGAGRFPDAESAGVAQVIRISLTGGNLSPGIAGADRLPGDANYFIGSDPDAWKTGVPTFGRVNYEGVYPGVDLSYYGNRGQLEFDFTVAPGADPELISLSYEGVESIARAAGGALMLKTASGDLSQAAPVIYQEAEGRKVRVDGEYVLREGRSVGFRVHDYDRSKPLVIDPVIEYSTLLGGTGGEAAFAVAVDSAGNSYVTGLTRSTDFPTVTPAQGTPGGGDRDVFVTKINPTGSAVLYSTYVGGSGSENGLGIAINPSGGAYVTGWTNSTNYPLASPLQNLYGGATDGFLTRLGPAGDTLTFSTYAGGSGVDTGTGVALDAAGNIYATGYTTSLNLQVVNALQPSKAAGVDAYLVKTDAAGSSIIYSTYLGGNGDDYGNRITVDGSGNVYGIGDTTSTDLLTPGGVQTFNAGDFDAYVAKLSADGSTLLYGTYAGGSGVDSGRAIELDSSGDIYAAGFTDSADLPTVNALQYDKGAGFDAFFAKLAALDGSIIYSSYLGGDGEDMADALAVDSAGNLFLTGRTTSTDFPVWSPAQASNGGFNDVFLSSVGPSGNTLLYSTYLGGSGNDVGWGVGLDGQSNAYVVGQAISANYPVVGSLQPFRGVSDAFVTKVSPPTGPAWTPTPTPEPATISFASATGAVLERDGTFGALVVRSGNLNRIDRITVQPRPDTASPLNDFAPFAIFLTFQPGVDRLVAPVTIYNGTGPEPNETFTLELMDAQPRTILAPNRTMSVTIVDDDTFPANTVQLDGNPNFSRAVPESTQRFGQSLGSKVEFTVTRTGDLSQPASVDYRIDHIPFYVMDFTFAGGALRFAAGETTKSISILITDDHYDEPDYEYFVVQLLNPVGTTISSTNYSATVTITDDDPPGLTTNASDRTPNFVDQHYNDFLNRQADASGFDFWSQGIDSCGADAACHEVKRINTSAAFFLSIEFQETGFLAYRMYKAAHGNIPNTPIPVRFEEFMIDTQEIGRGVEVGTDDWPARLEANKAAFQLAFVQRGRFKAALPEALTPAQYVDTLDANIGNLLTPQQREALITTLADGGNTTQARANVLRQVADSAAFRDAEFNRAFVLMQYFGYLRRDPDVAGYNFWLGKLNQFNGNFIEAEMVKAFITSVEYRRRFGQQ
ncbi:MAG: SBBP repeat-containing protein [Pyrinomonadaceae bacterium]